MKEEKNELLTVGEVAKILGVNKNTIIHYDREGLVKSVRSDNNYRYYHRKQIETFREILSLRKMGFSIEKVKEINECSASQNYSFILEMIKDRTEECRKEIEEIKKNIKVLGSYSKFVEYMKETTEHIKNSNFENRHTKKSSMEKENFFCIKLCPEERGIFIDIENAGKSWQNYIIKELKRYKRDIEWVKKHFFGYSLSNEDFLKGNYKNFRFIINAEIENYPDKYICPHGEHAFLYFKDEVDEKEALEKLYEKILENGYEPKGDVFIEDVFLFNETNKPKPKIKILKILVNSLTSGQPRGLE